MFDFLLVSILTLFAICYCFGVMRQNVYSSAVFTGVDLFALKFYLDRIVPINHSWYQKTRDGLPDGEDCIRLRSLVFWSVTDGRSDGFAVVKVQRLQTS